MSSNIENVTPKDHPINLYFGTSEDMNELKSKDNSSQSYVILQNNQLYYENSKLRQKIEKMKIDAENLSSDIDSLEKGKTCLKGLLHNEIEINQLSEEIYEIRENDTKMIIKHASTLVYEVYAMTIASMLLFAARDIVDPGLHEMMYFTQIIIMFGNMLSACVFTQSFKQTSTKEIEDRLKAARRGSENLHSIIDEL
jgi:hypothetical protein